ncbi:MAG: hypothetical protein RLZZ366_857 [Pseudomonadota bacterium]
MRLFNQSGQPRPGVAAVAFLGSKTARGEDDFALVGPATSCQRLEPGVNVGRQPQRVDIKPDLHRRRHFVDILTARPRGGKETLLKSAFG